MKNKRKYLVFSKLTISKRSNGILSSRVLVLNQNYEPISICNAKKAILLLYLGKAELVEAKNGKVVRSAKTQISVPSIVRLDIYIRIPFQKIILSRKNILRRDGHQCQYCGSHGGNLTLDHIIPKSQGGEDTWENLITACVSCNNKKDDRKPEDVNMKLLRQPRKPNHITFIRHSVNKIDERWKPYLFLN